MKFLHCADLHLGSRVSSREASGLSLSEELVLALERILELAKEESVDLLLIAGDFFESAHMEPVLGRRVKSLFNKARSFPILMVAGNHDPLMPRSPYETYLRDVENLYIFPAEQVSRVDFPDCQCSVYGASFSSIYQREMLLPQVDAEDKLPIHLGLVHGEVSAQASLYNLLDLNAIAESGLHYLAMGHIHLSNVSFPNIECLTKMPPKGVEVNVPHAGDVAYAWPGCPQGKTFKEAGPKGVLIGEIDPEDPKSSLRVRFIPIAYKNFEQVEIELPGEMPEEDISDLIQNKIAEQFGETAARHIYRIYLRGRDQGEHMDLSAIETRVSRHYAHVRLLDEREPQLNLQALEEEASLRGAFVRLLQNEMDQCEDEAQRSYLLDVLKMGLRAFDGEAKNDVRTRNLH